MVYAEQRVRTQTAIRVYIDRKQQNIGINNETFSSFFSMLSAGKHLRAKMHSYDT